jgi:seryl-tRNA synthetase
MPDFAKEYIETLRAKNKHLAKKLKEAEQERDKLQARLDDALKTLEPFEAVSQPGYAADSLRPRTVTVTEGDLCQAWQVLKVGSRWRPEEEE